MLPFIILKQSNPTSFRNSVTIRPPLSYLTGRIIDEEQANKYGITQDTRFTMTPNMMIQLGDEKALFWLEYAKKSGIVAPSLEEAAGKPNCAYYIYNPEEAAVNNAKHIDEKVDCLVRIKELSPAKKVELAKMLGFNPNTMSLSVLTNHLYQIAENTPTKDANMNYRKINELLNDEYYNEKLLIADALLSGLIVINNGQYFYNDTYLGSSVPEVIKWTQQSDNQTVVNVWKREVYKQDIEEVIVNVTGNSKFKKPNVSK
jgi:hypothetical protein